MAQRVLLGDLGGGQYGLKVSRPGYDVFSASGSQLAFDSTFPNVARVHMSWTNTSVNAGQGRVGYGKTFSNIPPFFWFEAEVASGFTSNLDYLFRRQGTRIVDYRSSFGQGVFNIKADTTGFDWVKDSYRKLAVIVLDIEQ